MSNSTATAPVASDPLFGGQPALPYDGTTGHSGSSASASRAHREAADGTAEGRQRAILTLLEEAGPVGLTWGEVGRRLNQHHGQVTGALSSMHKAGLVAALRGGRREQSSVYVLPKYVNGRDVRPFRGRPAAESQGRQAAMEETYETPAGAAIEAAATAPPFALSAEEETLLANIEGALPRFTDKGAVPLRKQSVAMLVAALRRAAAQ